MQQSEKITVPWPLHTLFADYTFLCRNFIPSLFSKERCNFLHPSHLLNMEGAAIVTMTTPYTVCGVLLQLAIVIFRHRVSRFSQVIVFIAANIKPARQGAQWLQYTQVL